MRRFHALILLLAALLAVALWFFTESGKSEPADSTSEPAVESIAPGAALPDPESLASTGALARTEAPGSPSDPPTADTRTLTVRVVFDADGRPAAGAEVLMQPGDAHKRLATAEFLQYQQENYDEQLDRWGIVQRCDASGVAVIPMPESGWFPVGARHDGLWGSHIVREEERESLAEIEITLQPAIHLRVLVVNEMRQPVPGIQVVYRPVDRDGRGNDSEKAVTGADGIGHLRHLQTEYQRMKDHCAGHVVALGLAFEPPVQAAFDPLAPPLDPIVLVMPGTGTVEVEVYTLTGEPAEGLRVALQRKMSDEERKRFIVGVGMEPQSWLGLQWQPVKNGIARFEGVGLGLTLEFGADFDRSRLIESGFGLGPQKPGETVRFVLRQTATAPVITGRLITADGQPVAAFDFMPNIYVPGVHHPVARQRLTTDAEGRFRFPIDLDLADARPKILMASQEEPGKILLLISDFPAPLAVGVNDLGDLVLGGPLLVSGVALTPEGEPASTAYGSVEPPFNPFASRETELPFDNIQWKAGGDGRFEIRGNLPERTYQVRAWVPEQQDWRLEDLRFERGAQDLELRFQRPPGVRGRVLVDAGVDLQQIHVMLWSEHGGQGTSPSGEDGTFTLLVKEPGKYDFKLNFGMGGSLLWSRNGLDLAEGGSHDFGDIDLRGLPQTRITLIGTDRASVPAAALGIRDALGKATSSPQMQEFPVTLLHTTEKATAVIDAPGCARAEVPLTGGEQSVRLQPGFPVSITLNGLPPIPEGASWTLTLTEAGPDGSEFPSRVSHPLPADSSLADLTLPAPGAWRLSLSYRKSARGGSSGTGGAFGENDAVVELRSTTARQEFSFDVDTAALERLFD
jgi:hypothetical protein